MLLNLFAFVGILVVFYQIGRFVDRWLEVRAFVRSNRRRSS